MSLHVPPITIIITLTIKHFPYPLIRHEKHNNKKSVNPQKLYLPGTLTLTLTAKFPRIAHVGFFLGGRNKVEEKKKNKESYENGEKETDKSFKWTSFCLSVCLSVQRDINH